MNKFQFFIKSRNSEYEYDKRTELKTDMCPMKHNKNFSIVYDFEYEFINLLMFCIMHYSRVIFCSLPFFNQNTFY